MTYSEAVTGGFRLINRNLQLVAVQVAIKDQMDLSLSIAMSSSLQIALFVAPVLVFVSLLMGHPLTLEFNSFELISLFAAALISALLVVYAIVALAFFFLPSV